MSILDALGKGVMPQFQMRGGGSSVPFADLSSQAAATTAAGIDMRDQMAEKFSSDSSAFSDGLDYLKDLMSPEDQEEELLEDLVSSEPDLPIAPEEAADEGGFSFNDLFSPYTSVDEATGETTDQSTGEALLARGTTGLALTPALKRILIGGKGNPFVTAGLAVPEVLRIGGSLIAPEATAALEEKIGAGYNKYVDPIVSPVTGAISDKISEIEAAQDIEEEAFKEALLSQGADEESQYFDEAVTGGSMTADELDEYENMISDPLPSFDNYYADGGRVNLNTGGLTYGYTPFMDAQQGLNYYNQFAAPDYGITGIADQAEEAVEDAQEEATVVNETLGTALVDRGGGPEDRGSYSDRFGTAEDQGYGYSGVPGEGGSATFNNPEYGEYGDTFTPGPGIGMAYDQYGKLVDIGTFNDIGLNMYNFAYPIAKMKPGIPGILENMINANKKYNEKKAQEEREALAQQVKDDAIDLSTDIKDRFESYNVGGNDNDGTGKPGNVGTGTFSGGQVSGFTGQGQTPHSSMSVGPKGEGKKDGPSTNNNSGNDGVGGGAGPKGGTGKPGDGNRGPGKSRCFVKGTMVEMADGTTKEITTITPGMETRGGTVEFVLQGLPVDIWDYKGVKVSGTHWVVEDNQLIAVEDSKHGIKTDMFEPVYSMKTSKQRMWVKGIEFGDFESGTDEDWEPYFEKVRQDLNKKLDEKRR